MKGNDYLGQPFDPEHALIGLGHVNVEAGRDNLRLRGRFPGRTGPGLEALGQTAEAGNHGQAGRRLHGHRLDARGVAGGEEKADPRGKLAIPLHRLEVQVLEKMTLVGPGHDRMGSQGELQLGLLDHEFGPGQVQGVGAVVVHQVGVNHGLDILRGEPHLGQGLLEPHDRPDRFAPKGSHDLGRAAGVHQDRLLSAQNREEGGRNPHLLPVVAKVGQPAGLGGQLGGHQGVDGQGHALAFLLLWSVCSGRRSIHRVRRYLSWASSFRRAAACVPPGARVELRTKFIKDRGNGSCLKTHRAFTDRVPYPIPYCSVNNPRERGRFHGQGD